jgi:hypothetical protein
MVRAENRVLHKNYGLGRNERAGRGFPGRRICEDRPRVRGKGPRVKIVGHDRDEWSEDEVHTIDLWFSARRGVWIVERLNSSGHLVGTAHSCSSLEDAQACLEEWLRSHDEAHMTSPAEQAAAKAQKAKPTGRRPPETRRAA